MEALKWQSLAPIQGPTRIPINYQSFWKSNFSRNDSHMRAGLTWYLRILTRIRNPSDNTITVLRWIQANNTGKFGGDLETIISKIIPDWHISLADPAQYCKGYVMLEWWHHDNCIKGGKKRGTDPTCVARHVFLESVAYLMAWNFARVQLSEARHVGYQPTPAEIASSLVLHFFFYW